MELEYQSKTKESINNQFMKRMNITILASLALLGSAIGINYYATHRSMKSENNLVSFLNPHKNEPAVKEYLENIQETRQLRRKFSTEDVHMYSRWGLYEGNPKLSKEILEDIRKYNALLEKNYHAQTKTPVKDYYDWDTKTYLALSKCIDVGDKAIDYTFIPLSLGLLGLTALNILKRRKELRKLEGK